MKDTLKSAKNMSCFLKMQPQPEEERQVRHGLDPWAREQLLRETLVFATMSTNDLELQAWVWAAWRAFINFFYCWTMEKTHLFFFPFPTYFKMTILWQASFWSGGFAQLLLTPTIESEEHWAHASATMPLVDTLPVQSLRDWLKMVEKSTQWPSEIQILSDLLKCNIHADVIAQLWRSHRHLLCEPGSNKINGQVVTGIWAFKTFWKFNAYLRKEISLKG